MTTTRAVTTTVATEHRILRRLDPATDGQGTASRTHDWHEWEHLTSGDRDLAERRLRLYQQDRGEYRLEQRQVVTMTEAWGPVE